MTLPDQKSLFAATVRDDRGRVVRLGRATTLPRTPDFPWWRRPPDTYNYAEPAATEYQLLVRTYLYATVAPGLIYGTYILCGLVALAFPSTMFSAWVRWFKYSHFSWSIFLACFIVMTIPGLIMRGRFAARLRAAYLAAHRCPACAAVLSPPPDDTLLAVCPVPSCLAAWQLPPSPAPPASPHPAFPVHPLHCPRCDYDLKGVGHFKPCPECGLALEPNSLVEMPILKVVPVYVLTTPADRAHPDAIPPKVLIGPDLERYRRGECPYCGYNRKGLAAHARCPECASTIARRASRVEDPPPPGSRPVCARCGHDMRGRENNRTCPDCGVMNGLRWVCDPPPA
jgi:hypothetical protein